MTSEGDPWAGDVGRRFVVDHYRSVRGQVRTQVVDRHLRTHLPAAPTAVVDIGGGAGTQSLPLARRGHRVTIIDPSAAMLDRARRALANEPVAAAERVDLIEASGEEALAAVGDTRFAAVLCHGVIPYVAAPRLLVSVLCALARPEGIVSILTKNARTLAVRPALEERWADALRAFDATEEVNALGLRTRADTVDEVTGMLAEHGVRREAWYGVRLFVDHLHDDRTAGAAELAQIVAVEHEASRRDPYRQLSRLFHLVGRRPGRAHGAGAPGGEGSTRLTTAATHTPGRRPTRP